MTSAHSRRICELEGCDETFAVTSRTPSHKRFCSDRHRRIAEKRRHRERHTERVNCKGCGTEFERTATSKRLQVYCTLDCQAESRSAEYQERPDILAGMARAQAARQTPTTEEPTSAS